MFGRNKRVQEFAQNQQQQLNNNPLLNQNMGQGVQLEPEELQKWESDPEPFFDKIFNNLIGNVEDSSTGKWIRSFNRTRLMNEKGASNYVNQLRLRFSTPSQNGELENKQIHRIILDSGKSFSDQLCDYYDDWEIDPKRSNFYNIALGYTHALEELLSVVKNGGFKTHKEKRRGYYASPQQEAY